MNIIQAIVLFILGVGAAFLAYFAWHHVQGIGTSDSAPIVTASNVIPIRTMKPGIAAQV